MADPIYYPMCYDIPGLAHVPEDRWPRVFNSDFAKKQYEYQIEEQRKIRQHQKDLPGRPYSQHVYWAIESTQYQFFGLAFHEPSDIVSVVDHHSGRKLKLPTLKNPLGLLTRKTNWETESSRRMLKGYWSYRRGKEPKSYDHVEFTTPREKPLPMNINIPTIPYKGNWEANNSLVWDVIEPGLRIAEMLLMDRLTLAYLHRIFGSNGKIERIDDSLKFDPQDQNEYFRVRLRGWDSKWVDDIRGKVKHHLDLLSQDTPTRIGFMNKNLDPMYDRANPSLGGEDAGAWGLTWPLARPGKPSDWEDGGQPVIDLARVNIYIQVELIQHLFLHNPSMLPDLELRGAQFHIAITFVHEVVHALWLSYVREYGRDLRIDESKYHLEDGGGQVEHGFEWEVGALGGIVERIIPREKGPGGAFGWEIHTWPSLLGYPPPPIEPPLPDTRELRFLTVEMIEQFHQEDFWKTEYTRNESGKDWLEEEAKKDWIQRLAKSDPTARRAIRWAEEFAQRTGRMDSVTFDLEEANLGLEKILGLLSANADLTDVMTPIILAIQIYDKSVGVIAEATTKERTIPPYLQSWRLSLLEWNFMTRSFLRQLQDHFENEGNDERYANAIESTLLMTLEKSRMQLADPLKEPEDGPKDDGLHLPEKHYEDMNDVSIAFKRAISGDEDQMRLAFAPLDGLLRGTSTSVFDMSCAELINIGLTCILASDGEISEDITVWREDTDTIYQDLENLRALHKLPPLWNDLIGEWMVVAYNVQQGLRRIEDQVNNQPKWQQQDLRPSKLSDWLGEEVPSH
ncbi:hypothetical protein HYALB_00002223 [Hymenoscyphus albidus]|uniref:Uncharacterized protein n=1 Tax=Hymenoscyphus albidus TaxID=595503 RepID=A0A9N9LJF9_9HELO|nr:hypothetical protein HYALB_00002223 [Hymenoscyphus albidus]